MLRRHPVSTMNTAASSTAATPGMTSSTMSSIMPAMMRAAIGAFRSSVTRAARFSGCPNSTNSSVYSSRAVILSQVP